MWRMPDVTRLLDRVAAAGLITRHRPADDQRTVLATLTDKGWNLVEKSHETLLELNRSQFAHMSRTQVLELITLLRKALDRKDCDAPIVGVSAEVTSLPSSGTVGELCCGGRFRLFNFDLGVSDDFSPPRDFLVLKCSELLGGRSDHFNTQSIRPLGNVRQA